MRGSARTIGAALMMRGAKKMIKIYLKTITGILVFIKLWLGLKNYYPLYKNARISSTYQVPHLSELNASHPISMLKVCQLLTLVRLA